MVITPTNSGSLLAGAGLGFFAWGAFLKVDKVPWLKVLLTTRRKDETLAWVNKNRGLSLLGLESVNYGLHGILDPNSVFFALGNTVVNILFLWIFLPFRIARAAKKRQRDVLKGVA
jgi:hypothetical protein